MLRPEIGSSKPDLMKPIFYIRRSVRIRAICTEKLLSDFSKFEIFDKQEFHNMTLLQLRRIDTFQLSAICTSGMPASFFSGKFKNVTLSMDFPWLSLVRV
jgi:hypothetical protein